MKDELIKILFFYSDQYISSEMLARKLGTTKMNIYSLIRKLRNEGYTIHGSTGKGFSLQNIEDKFLQQNICSYSSIEPEKIRIFKTLPSTNVTAKEMASCGAPEGTICIAHSQTKGHGRFNRVFYSPETTGLYMSLILRPTFSPTLASHLTPLAAVAVAEAIESFTNEPVHIKWVNDIYYKEKKVCGILSESSVNADTHKINYIILGIGINLYEPKEGFPKELENVAGALFTHPIPDLRSRMVAAILKRFFFYYRKIEKKEFLNPYRNRSFLAERNVEVHRGNTSYEAKVIGITDDFELHVLLPDNKSELISSGEVSIKL